MKDRLPHIIISLYSSKTALISASIIALFMFLMGVIQLLQLKFDFDFESFFPKDHPDLTFFNEFKEDFAYDNDYLLLALENQPSIFEKQFLEKVDLLTQNLRNIEGTESLLSPTDFALPIKASFGVAHTKILHIESIDRLKQDSIKIASRGNLEKNLFSENFDALMIQIQHKHFESLEASIDYLQQVDSVLAVFPEESVHMAGRVPVQKDFIGLIQNDFAIFIAVGFVIIIIFLTWQFRSVSGVVIPLIIIVWSTVVTLGFIILNGDELNILTVLIPTILAFVSLSDVIHFLTKYDRLIYHGYSKDDALVITVREIGIATFLTSITTAIGFLSLLSIQVIPIQMLGVYTAFGVVLAFLITFLVIPIRILFYKKKIVRPKLSNQHFWDRISIWFFRTALRNQRTIITVSVGFIFACIFGLAQLEVNAELLDDLPDNQSIKLDFEFFDTQFGGTKPWQLAVFPGENKSIYSLPVLQELEEIETYLKKQYPVQQLVSPVAYVKFIHQGYQGGASSEFRLPTDEETLQKVLVFGKRFKQQSMVKIDADDYSRFAGFIREYGSKDTHRRDLELQKYIENEINPKLVTAKITGTTLLIDKSHEFLSENLLRGITLALVVVAVLAVLLFRSWYLLFVALIPNMLPVLGTAALIGYLGIPIKLTTSIIFTISFGIAVDDTIHFISKFRIETRKGIPVLYALKNTFQSTGKAMIITTILLSAGFGIFCFSNFGATYLMGVFVCTTLVAALVIDLLLLPVLLHIFYPLHKKYRKIWS